MSLSNGGRRPTQRSQVPGFRIRRVSRLLPVWLLAAFAIALLTPPLAGAETNSAATTETNSLEVQGYQKEFGVSAQMADKNLATQQLGAGVVGQLKAVQGRRFAGVWFDNETDEFVVPLLVNADRASAENTLGDDNLESNYRTESVRYSWEELEAAQERIDEAANSLFAEHLVRTFLDASTNAVVVELADGASKADREEVASQAETANVMIEVRSANLKTFHGERASCDGTKRVCDRPLRGGVKITPKLGEGEATLAACSAGFKAIGKIYGNRFMLTAGHCVMRSEGKIFENWQSEESEGHNKKIGYAEQYSWTGGDWAKIRVNGYGAPYWEEGSSWPSEIAYWGENQEYAIEHEAWSYEGEYVCHSGFYSGASCGKVTKLDVTENDQEEVGGPPEYVYHLAEFGPACVHKGDSGGPVFAGGVALGILSSFNANLPECENYIQYNEVPEAANALGVTVGPLLGGAPTAETEVATNIHGHEATVYGTTDPDGLPTTYHFEYGPTTSYGSSVPVPEGSAGHGPNYVRVNATISGLPILTTYHYRFVATNESGTAYGADAQFKTTAAPPIVTTEAATGVASGAATLHGTANPQGADTHYYFEWGTTTGYGNEVPIPHTDIGSGTSNVAVSNAISGIKGETTYHFRVVASNEEGTSYGADQQFTAPNWKPIATTEAITELKAHGATLHATINPQGFDTHYQFEYGKTTSYGTSVPIPSADVGSGTSNVKESNSISGLELATTYHFRVVATNSEGTTDGKDVELKTPNKPAETTEPASEVATIEPRLNATVNPEGLETHYYFEYGKTTSYGTKIPAEPGADIGSEAKAQSVSQKLGRLELSTTYHFRVVATNEGGTTDGSDKEFTTPAVEWQLNEAQLLEGTPVTLKGKLTFSDELTLLGSYSVECETSGEGSAGAGAADKETNPGLSHCATKTGSSVCELQSWEPYKLPWQSELSGSREAVRDTIGSSGSPAGVSLKCHNIFEGTFTDTCTGTLSATMKNVTKGVEATLTGEKWNCSEGGTGKGSVKGSEVIENTGGKTLKVV